MQLMVEKELPEDIIETILTRLPVRSLIKFRSVSKRWRSIISDPRFAKKHRRFASEQKNLRSRLLFSTASQLVSLDLEETRSVGDVVKPSINKQLTYRELGCRVKLVGSCNGLVCVAYNVTTLLIWNPSTGCLDSYTSYLSYIFQENAWLRILVLAICRPLMTIKLW